ncbi:hypothetical protein [Sinorhizobium fredii]|uniref:hypothetical protein n=1 Tax=Rhizobium fredii TaxID=380 RepID=UPI0004B46C35|nr:hypothetical protein [Sinorhizobium fredii]
MANWLEAMTIGYFGNIEDITREEVNFQLTGVFIARDRRQDVVDRVISDEVRSSPECEQADPDYFVKKYDPERYARRHAKTEEEARRWYDTALPEIDPDCDIPF